MMQFDDWVKRVKSRVPECCEARNGEVDFDHILFVALQELGMHVADNGMIADPRPAPPVAPHAQNARWGGGRRRR